jgi:hypothetical protein
MMLATLADSAAKYAPKHYPLLSLQLSSLSLQLSSLSLSLQLSSLSLSLSFARVLILLLLHHLVNQEKGESRVEESQARQASACPSPSSAAPGVHLARSSLSLSSLCLSLSLSLRALVASLSDPLFSCFTSHLTLTC